MQAIVTLLGAGAFLLWLSPLLVPHQADDKQPLKPVLHVGFSAWLTNLAAGALFKQVSIALLTIYAISLADIGYFNLSFQLADAANVLLVSGFAGVGASALAASFVGHNYERLGRSWQSLIKVETLLAAPGLVFCLFNAQNIAIALYGSKFAAVGPLLAIFLAFNLLYRIIGTPIHQCSLYVIGKPQTVVISQWFGLLLIIVMGIMLVPRFGPAGALMADGIAKALTGIFMLGFLLWKISTQTSIGYTPLYPTLLARAHHCSTTRAFLASRGSHPTRISRSFIRGPMPGCPTGNQAIEQRRPGNDRGHET